jgi:hypothetical protein
MRRFVLASALFLSACATRPEQVAAPQPTTAPAPVRRPSELVGWTAAELIGEFGTPALQVREGTSLKLQFRRPACVLDAYLYPSGANPPKVTYVDTRLPSGADTDQAACIAALLGRS